MRRLAVRRLVDEGRIDHLDLNFGCPVRKVTRKGGGAAIPAKPKLLTSIVRAAVSAAGKVPVTIKFRMGIDDEHLTSLTPDTGKILLSAGVSYEVFDAVVVEAVGGYLFFDDRDVTGSQVYRPQAIRPALADGGATYEAGDPVPLGNGSYTFQGGVVALGLRWAFDAVTDDDDEQPAATSTDTPVQMETPDDGR